MESLAACDDGALVSRHTLQVADHDLCEYLKKVYYSLQDRKVKPEGASTPAKQVKSAAAPAAAANAPVTPAKKKVIIVPPPIPGKAVAPPTPKPDSSARKSRPAAQGVASTNSVVRSLERDGLAPARAPAAVSNAPAPAQTTSAAAANSAAPASSAPATPPTTLAQAYAQDTAAINGLRNDIAGVRGAIAGVQGEFARGRVELRHIGRALRALVDSNRERVRSSFVSHMLRILTNRRIDCLQLIGLHLSSRVFSGRTQPPGLHVR